MKKGVLRGSGERAPALLFTAYPCVFKFLRPVSNAHLCNLDFRNFILTFAQRLNSYIKSLRSSPEKKVDLAVSLAPSDLDLKVKLSKDYGIPTTLKLQCTSNLHSVTLTPMKPASHALGGYAPCSSPISFPSAASPDAVMKPKKTRPNKTPHMYVTLPPPCAAVLLTVSR